ncbi:MAG: SDR family NAD(P)-dependent oxidoreductase [Protaetiibacter sp.]
MTGENPRHRAVVTGGCGDIGRAIGRRLARDGFAVTLVDLRDEAEGTAIAASTGDAVSYLRGDVTDATAMTEVVEALDRLDVVVANAGIGRSAPVLELSESEWRAHLDVNLGGAFHTAQAAARRMVREGTPGRLLFTSSWIGSIPWPEMTAYAVSKAGIEMLAKQFARELAPHGIRANVIAPGIVKAGMARVQLETEPAYAARAARVIPLGELQSVDDVAEVVSFLASPGAAYLTGTKITADGGGSLFAFD